VLVHRDAAGRIIRITGDKESPTSKGFICPKGASAAGVLYHPGRITRPLRRVKGRGEGVWEPISWDAATDMIAGRFQRIMEESGPEHIAVAQGTGRPYTEFNARFCHALGSPNFVSPGFNCFVPRNICAGITIGWFPQPDIYGRGGAMPRCMMVLGSNIMESGGADGYCGAMARRALRGADLSIVIDPRATTDAKAAHLHLALRPGTECALLLGMIHAVIREKAYDAPFVATYCEGFDALAAHVAPYSPQWAEGVTRVRAADIERAALGFARTGPSCLLWGNGIDQSVNAFQTARAACILLAICGALDVPGGMVRWAAPANIRCKSPMINRELDGMRFLSPERKAKIISDYPFCPGAHPPSFWQACVSGKPYRPRAIWLVGANPILTQTRGDLTQKALRDCMDFVVVSDLFMTPTAALADVFLPAAHWLEQEDIVFFHKIWCVLARKKLAQVGEARDDRAVTLEVARKMGLSEAFPWENWRAYLNWILEPSGMSLEEFLDREIFFGEMRYRKHERDGFPTPGGKVELYSSVMAGMGRNPLPVYAEPPLSPLSRPDLAKDYPYILMTGCKTAPFFHSGGRQIPERRKLRPRPHADMHPDAAGAAGFVQGQKVKVITPYGAQEFFLNMDERLPPDVAHVEHAWWFPEEQGPEYGCFRSNANMLFGHEHFDPDSGAEPLKCLICRIEAVRDQ
jgi:anaerobic selenocysteine-containing dehydrogenase